MDQPTIRSLAPSHSPVFAYADKKAHWVVPAKSDSNERLAHTLLSSMLMKSLRARGYLAFSQLHQSMAQPRGRSCQWTPEAGSGHTSSSFTECTLLTSRNASRAAV